MARGLKALHQNRERIILMLECVEYASTHMYEQGFKRCVTRDGRFQHQWVDEVTDERSKLGLASTRGNRANQKLLLARVAIEQRLKRGEQCHVERSAMFTTKGS